MANGRCKLHGGKSTGPRTAAGVEAIQRARTKHGFYLRAPRDLDHSFHAIVITDSTAS
jgi:hypothetical protein